VVPQRDRVRIAPVGELDILTVPELERVVRELLQSGFDHLIIDLSQLDFLESSGLKLLLTLQGEAARGAFVLELLPGCPAVQRVFELTSTFALLPFAWSPAPKWPASPRRGTGWRSSRSSRG